MTDRYLDHLATLVADIRADVEPAWQMPGIMTALRSAIALGEPRAATACAALRAAADADNRTPAVIAMPGDHWRADDAPRTTTPMPPRWLPGVDDAPPLNADVARRGAAACRAELGDPSAADTARRDGELARLTRRIREVAPTLTTTQRDRLIEACTQITEEEPDGHP